MAHDELEIARRFEATMRALRKQYPELTTPAAQRRLVEYLETEMEKEHRMPPKGQRSMGEDTTPIAVRLPRSIIAKVDAHMERLRKQHPYMPINRVHALSDLIRRACEALAADVTDTVTDTPVTDEAAMEPPLGLDLEDTPLTMKPTDVTQESVAPPAPAEPVQTAKTTTKKHTTRTTKGR